MKIQKQTQEPTFNSNFQIKQQTQGQLPKRKQAKQIALQFQVVLQQIHSQNSVIPQHLKRTALYSNYATIGMLCFASIFNAVQLIKRKNSTGSNGKIYPLMSFLFVGSMITGINSLYQIYKIKKYVLGQQIIAKLADQKLKQYQKMIEQQKRKQQKLKIQKQNDQEINKQKLAIIQSSNNATNNSQKKSNTI